jgi:hypothetical protein
VRVRRVLLLGVLVLAGCGSGSTETVEVTTTVQMTTTVEAQPTTSGATTTTRQPAALDPDDVPGQLDIRDLTAKRNGDLISVSVKTYDPWSSNVLVGSPTAVGPNRLTVYYDIDLDGHWDRRGRIIFAGGRLSLFLSGGGQQFEAVPVERPSNLTARYVHPVDIFFVNTSSQTDIQVRVKSFYNGVEDRAPDHGWVGVPFNP